MQLRQSMAMTISQRATMVTGIGAEKGLLFRKRTLFDYQNRPAKRPANTLEPQSSPPKFKEVNFMVEVTTLTGAGLKPL
jgi:hypothetical protein